MRESALRAFAPVLPLVLFGLAACSSSTPASTPGSTKVGLSADPRWLTFQCIKPGCDTSLKVTVTQEGARRIAIKRIVLSDSSRTDFTVETAEQPPFVVPGTVEITVRHVPQPGSDPGDVNLLVTYTDATADDSPNRVPPGELSIPLLRRLIGEPVMVASPAQVSFGAAWLGDTIAKSVSVENAGYGNVSIDVARVESDSEEIQPGVLPTGSLLPGEKLEVPVIFSPTASRFTRATLTFHATDPSVTPATVVALATSLTSPQAAADPATVDFGEVACHQPRTAQVTLLNQGGSELSLSGLKVLNGGANVTASLEGGASLTLQPLQSAVLTVTLSAQTAGEVAAVVNLTTNETFSKNLQIPVTALVLEPKASPAPASLDFGNVFKGWSKVLPVTVENAGWGDLVVSNVSLVSGTSELYSLRTVPVLPATLKRGQRLGLEVEFRADAIATFTGAVSVESNDPNAAFLQIPLTGTGTTCEIACPLANATPSCSSGACVIDECDSHWYDTDGKVETGCECRDALDTGPFCADATSLGQLTTDYTSASYQGVLPVEGDEDTVRFTSDGHFWGSHTITMTLNTTDPTIEMCAAVRSGSDCPTAQDGFTCGSPLTSDAEDSSFLIKVSRSSGAAPTCTPYTVTVTHD